MNSLHLWKTTIVPSGEKLGRFSEYSSSANNRRWLLPSAFMIQSWGIPSGGGNSLKTICLPSADQEGQLAELSGPRWVSCLMPVPSGFMVKTSPSWMNVIRPFLPGKVAHAGSVAITRAPTKTKLRILKLIDNSHAYSSYRIVAGQASSHDRLFTCAEIRTEID